MPIMSRKTYEQSPTIPKEMKDKFQALTELSDDFCKKYLNEDYAILARRAFLHLCNEKQNSVARGRADIWVCAVLYALGQNNFLGDKATAPYMSMEDLCKKCGVSQSTAMNKSRLVRDTLEMDFFNAEWMLPDIIEDSIQFWLVPVNGLLVDARNLPRDMQETAFEQGLIPYIHTDNEREEPEEAERCRLLDAYRHLRDINRKLQSKVLKRAIKNGSVMDFARRLGLVKEAGKNNPIVMATEETVIPAFDLALYTLSTDGLSEVQHYAKKTRGKLKAEESKVLRAMESTRFSVFRVAGKHKSAGVVLIDLLNGGEIWLMDRGLEMSAERGTVIALRIFRPDEFWMTTGVFAPLNWPDKDCTEFLKQNDRSTYAFDVLEENIYRSYIAEEGEEEEEFLLAG
jgi:hypothetical protein